MWKCNFYVIIIFICLLFKTIQNMPINDFEGYLALGYLIILKFSEYLLFG